MTPRLMLLLACLIFPGPAAIAATDCSSIANAGTRDDGTWLYRKNGTWWPVAALTADVQDGRPRKVTFAYVAREPALKSARRGILVIKTGIEGPQAADTGRVALVRDSYPRDQGACEAYADFPSGKSVRIRSYDYYHDYSQISDPAEGRTLKAYHVDYLARGSGCKRSDDATPDGYFSSRRRSNRSDFSFNPEVVRGGQYSQFWSQFGFGTAYAEPLAERQVTIKRYAADADGLACVVFDATLKPGGFIRINDLERRIGDFRSDEQSWAWPR